MSSSRQPSAIKPPSVCYRTRKAAFPEEYQTECFRGRHQYLLEIRSVLVNRSRGPMSHTTTINLI